MLSRAALLVTAVAIAVTLARGPHAGAGTSVALLVVAFAALAVAVSAERRVRRRAQSGDGDERGGLTRRPVLLLGGGLLALAVAVPPTQSGDVWSYAMYGRMLAHDGASPYRHTPAEYRNDPIGRRVPPFWVRSRSVYGPLFTALSAGGMAVAGSSALAARLFFQLLAALAVAAAAVLIDRHLRDPVALAVLLVNPITVVSVVNGGHNDALVGLALLAGALLAARRRPGWAGLALAAAVSVKVAVVLPVAALVVWVWARQGRRPAVVVAVVAAGVAAAGVLVADPAAVATALGDAQGRVNGGSVWAGVHRLVTGTSVGATADATGRAVAWAGTATAVALTALLTLGRPTGGRAPRETSSRNDGALLVAGAGVVAYLLVGAYVLPWYLAWGLPVLAVHWRWWPTWVAVGQAAVLQLATARPGGGGAPDPLSVGSAFGRFQLDLYTVGAPILEVLLVALVVALSVGRLVPAQSRRSSATRNASSSDWRALRRGSHMVR